MKFITYTLTLTAGMFMGILFYEIMLLDGAINTALYESVRDSALMDGICPVHMSADGIIDLCRKECGAGALMGLPEQLDNLG